MKLLIKGYYGFGNLGDDLLVLFFYRIIKKHFPNDDIYIFSNASENNADFKQHVNYNRYLINLLDIKEDKIIDWTYKAHFDIVINGGGGTFFDYSNASSQRQIINKLVSLFSPRTIYKTEKLFRKIVGRQPNITFDRSYAIGNNVGPFDTYSNRFIRLYSQVGSIDKFIVRDLQSQDYLNKFNYNGSYEQISDVVFCKTYLPEIVETEVNNTIKTIGITIMNWESEGEKYLDKFVELSKVLKKQNIKTKLFAFSELDDQKLQNFTNYNINIWKPNEMNISDYIEKLSLVDCMICMRFHALVIANIQNIPCIGVGINNKIIDYVEQTNKVNHLVTKNFSIDDIMKKVELINNNDTKKNNLANYKNKFFQTENIIKETIISYKKKVKTK